MTMCTIWKKPREVDIKFILASRLEHDELEREHLEFVGVKFLALLHLIPNKGKGVLFSSNVFLSLFNVTSIHDHEVFRMLVVASIESLMCLLPLLWSPCSWKKRWSREMAWGQKQAQHLFCFDDLPSLDEQISLESICTSIVVRL